MATTVPLVIADTIEITLRGRCLNQDIYNVFMYHYAGGLPAGESCTWSTGFRTNVLPLLLACLPSNYSAVSITTKNLHVANGEECVLLVTGSTAGTRGAGVRSNGVAFSMEMTTARSGRSYRGRKFIGPLYVFDYDNDVIITSLLNAIVNFLATLIISHINGKGVVAIASRKLHTSQIVNGGSWDLLIDRQWRRTTGHGK